MAFLGREGWPLCEVVKAWKNTKLIQEYILPGKEEKREEREEEEERRGKREPRARARCRKREQTVETDRKRSGTIERDERGRKEAGRLTSEEGARG